MTPRQWGPSVAPAATKNTTSGMGRPGMRLAANDDSTTTASIVASIASSVVMGLLLVGLDPSVLPNMADTSA